MNGVERGPLRSYEITWTTGHVETIKAHQVTWHGGTSIFSGADEGPRRIQFMGEIDRQWTLVLTAREDDIRVVRDVTAGENLPTGGTS